MTLKTLLLVGTLCLAGNSFLSAKSREFTIDKPVMCGSVHLAPGSYRVTVRGDRAEITDLNHFADKRPVSIPVTLVAADQKADHTTVMVTNDGNIDKVTEIDLSHSTTNR